MPSAVARLLSQNRKSNGNRKRPVPSLTPVAPPRFALRATGGRSHAGPKGEAWCPAQLERSESEDGRDSKPFRSEGCRAEAHRAKAGCARVTARRAVLLLATRFG